ncbi:MAG: Fe-S cluster assembly ATPase SufC [Patescibacteria group bacterium]
MKNELIVKNLHAQTVEGKKILNGISLIVKKGEIHALMGPNGGGKSTLAQILMGHPGYVVTKGKVIINGIDITTMTPDQKAKAGLFLGFQYPVEVAGVNYANFLRMAVNEQLQSRHSGKRDTERVQNPTEDAGQASMTKIKKLSPLAFRKQMTEIAKTLSLGDITKRSLNEGFSGGEKKKAEILQLAMLRPDFVVLDEPDSGLDVDALRYIAKAIQSLDYKPGLLLITHYQRILKYIEPDFVHILINGKIVQSGDASVAHAIEEKGYEGYLKHKI